MEVVNQGKIEVQKKLKSLGVDSEKKQKPVQDSVLISFLN